MEYNKEIKNRLRRIEGQVKGVLSMMEQGKDCKSVVAQLSAARNAIDRAIAVIVSTNLENCLRGTFSQRSGRAISKKQISQLLKKGLTHSFTHINIRIGVMVK